MRISAALIIIILCLSCTKEKNVEKHFVVGCNIYDENFVLIRKFTGYFCKFNTNGEWSSMYDNKLSFYSNKNQLKFTLPFNAHHDVTFSEDLKKIYTISTEFKMYKSKLTRFDNIILLNAKGEIKNSFSVFDNKDKLIKLFKLEKLQAYFPDHRPDRAFPQTEWEFSHLNAIYLIPANSLEKKYSFMKRGNILVTFNGMAGVAIFDPELKNILYYFKILKTNLLGIHDAQVLSNGHLIVFKNYNDPQDNPYTSINEYDFINDKIIWTFDFRQDNFAFTGFNGSVQVLKNDNLIISDYFNGGRFFEIDRTGRVLWSHYNNEKDQNSIPVQIYRAKKENLDSFLQNNFK